MLRFVFRVLVPLFMLLIWGRSEAALHSWVYDTVVDYQIYDCISPDGSKLYVCGLGGIINVTDDQWVVKDDGTVYKSFHQIDGRLACFNVRNQLVWFDENGVTGKTRFVSSSDESEPLEIKEIVAGKTNYVFLLHAPVRNGKMYFYYSPKKSLTDYNNACKLESAVIRRYKGDGEADGVSYTLDGTMILYGDNGIFKVEPTFKTVREEENKKSVFKDYAIQRVFPEVKHQAISSFYEDDISGTAYFSGSGLWEVDNGTCRSIEVPTCYVKPTVSGVEDMIVFENRLWLISKEGGIIAYHLEDHYFEQHKIFAEPLPNQNDSTEDSKSIRFPVGGNLNRPSFLKAGSKLYVVSNRGLWQLIPNDFERKPATIIAVGINHFLDAPVRDREDSLRSWDVVRIVLEQACRDYISQGMYLYGWPKDTALRYVRNDSVAPNFIKGIEQMIYNTTTVVPTHKATYWNPRMLVDMLRPEIHRYESVRIITISNGRDQFLPKEKIDLSSIVDSCGTRLSVNLINAKFKVASIHSNSEKRKGKRSWRTKNFDYLQKLHDSNKLDLQVFNFDEEGDLDASALACSVLKSLFNKNCAGLAIEPATRGEMQRMLEGEIRFQNNQGSGQ